MQVHVAESCLTLCDPMDYTVPGILQVRILEWVAFPSPADLPHPGIEPGCPALQADSLPAELPGKHPPHFFFFTIHVKISEFCEHGLIAALLLL